MDLNGQEKFGLSKRPVEAGDQGVLLDGLANITVFRQRGHWTQWVDFTPEPLKLQKVRGQWQIPPDTWLLRGKLPGTGRHCERGRKIIEELHPLRLLITFLRESHRRFEHR